MEDDGGRALRVVRSVVLEEGGGREDVPVDWAALCSEEQGGKRKNSVERSGRSGGACALENKGT